MDPNANYTYSTPDKGVGAYYSFDGDPELIGSGSLTIMESIKNESIQTEIIFLKEGEENGRGKSRGREKGHGDGGGESCCSRGR